MFAQSLIQLVLDEINSLEGCLSAIHVCRGNWTKDESVLLEGAYDKLGSFFNKLNVDMLALEFSTPRAGEVSKLFYNNFLDEKIILGLGVVNPRSDEVESVEDIITLAEEALAFLPPERLWLNPDCGFATFANRPLNSREIIAKKLENMVKAAQILRDRHCK
ncbi:5-methyltetrahydropteroyltriglutamate--homocysteine methyltransferase [Facklamia miroungae]|uniref:5-methyltetrahydropteroyltriglutamate--homocysteine methyltransferase n=2 Tax=Facklamia miroungae TaxID=120956 RepID=A0A1G7UNH7_9LACT|nr:methylcobamide--CoM methyltransferase [Facklamia miroungae]SDG49037.1 5-methyltetrahydropteroyltriglutamate--homocysteine methyltransferase [Facklamia miroungae]